MLVNLKEILEIAERQFMAVGAFNVPHLESLRATIGAAEQLNLPVIVQFAQMHESWTPLEYMAPVMIRAASEAKVPVCVHLDHGETLDYIQKALDLGFTSVMYDGSVLPFEENIANTRKAVAMAAVHGASVEELQAMFHQSIDNYLSLCQKIGKNPDKEFKGSFNVRIPIELHRQAALAAKRRHLSLNQYVVQAIQKSIKA